MNHLPTTLPAFLWHFVKKQKFLFLTLTICHLAWSIDQTIMPYIFKMFLDAIANYTGDKALIWQVIAFPVILGGSLWFITDAMFRLYEYIAIRTFPEFESSIRMSMFSYVQEHSYKYFADNFAGSVANKIGDMPSTATGLVSVIINTFIPTIIAFVIGCAIFTYMHPLFGLLLLSWFVFHIGICLITAKRCNDYSFNHSESNSTLTGKIVDSFTNIVAVKIFASQHRETQYIRKYQNDEKQNHKKLLSLLFKIRLAQGIICFLIQGVISTWLMIYQWQLGNLVSSDLVYIFYTSWGLTVMAWISGSMIPQFFKDVGTCNQALSLIKAKHEITDKKNAKDIKIDKGEISFKNVNFGYKDGRKLFKSLNITIKPGEKVGLVGLSGGGKTSFVNLIMRFFDIKSGRILIDGQNIARVTRSSLRNKIAMIPQDPTLFHRSLLENIRYARDGATEKEALKAAKEAHCDDFINDLPDKYESQVGERGIKLSGGQRQRIAIARAMLKDSPILILDEATSALDSLTEKLIQESLKKAMKDRTTIVIAHRLSTLSEMDRILVFDNGKIIEDGSPKKLLKSPKSAFSKLWNMQVDGFL